MILWFILVDVAIRLAQAMIATWYNYHDFSHFQHVIPFERVSFGFTYLHKGNSPENPANSKSDVCYQTYFTEEVLKP